MCSQDRYLSPAEVVRSLGVSVRALKLYERRGLLTPIKTSAGWRTYGPDQIGRLHEILALKGLGFSLTRIAEMLAGRTSDLARTLEMQSAALSAQRASADAALRLIEAARHKLGAGARLPIAELIELIRETTMDTHPAYMTAYQAELKKQLTDKEMAQLHHGMNRSRLQLVAELKALTASNEDPLSATSLDFMRRWSHAHRLLLGGDDALGLKTRSAWLTAIADPERAKDAPYGEAEVRYLASMGDAVRAEWARLFAKLEDMANAHADPASPAATALVIRMRGLSAVTNGHRSRAAMEERRETWRQTRTPLPGVTLSEPGLAFLTQASACAHSLIDAA